MGVGEGVSEGWDGWSQTFKKCLPYKTRILDQLFLTQLDQHSLGVMRVQSKNSILLWRFIEISILILFRYLCQKAFVTKLDSLNLLHGKRMVQMLGRGHSKKNCTFI